MTTLHLREWRLQPGLALSPSQVELLLAAFGAQVTPVPGSPGRYDVRPGSRVGVVQRGDDRVVVEPKLPVPRVLFLLAFASDPQGWQEDAELEAADDLPDAVVGLFLDRLQRSLARGLLHGYHEEAGAHVTVRGRIDLQEQLRLRPGLDLPVQLAYQEFDEDVLENRLLLAAVRRLRRVPLRSPALVRRVHRAVAPFELVSDVAFDGGDVPEVLWSRLNDHYRPAVELARLLLAHRSVELRGGSAAGSGLVLDMNEVFEAFVREALRRALGLRPEEFPVGSSVADLHLDEQRAVRLEPDLSWWTDGRCRFVGDVKYKRDSGPGVNGDLYQLLAYATAAGLPQGRLVYADGAPPARHVIRHAGVELVVDRVDVALPPADLLAAVERMAASVRHSAALAV